MATEKLVRVTCDRCKRVVHEGDVQPTNIAGAVVPRRFMLDAKGLQMGEVVFDDLCAKCIKRVGDLIQMIAKLDKSDENEASNEDDTGKAPKSAPPPVSKAK